MLKKKYEIFIIKWIYFLKKKNYEIFLVFIKILYLYYYLTFSSVPKKKKEVKKKKLGGEKIDTLSLSLSRFPFWFLVPNWKTSKYFFNFQSPPIPILISHSQTHTHATYLVISSLFLFLSLKRLTFSLSLFLCITKFEERGLVVFVFFLIIKIIFKR